MHPPGQIPDAPRGLITTHGYDGNNLFGRKSAHVDLVYQGSDRVINSVKCKCKIS